jgi:hypothetical protein
MSPNVVFHYTDLLLRRFRFSNTAQNLPGSVFVILSAATSIGAESRNRCEKDRETGADQILHHTQRKGRESGFS